MFIYEIVNLVGTAGLEPAVLSRKGFTVLAATNYRLRSQKAIARSKKHNPKCKKNRNFLCDFVAPVGLEPTRAFCPTDLKSVVSTNSTTGP